MMQGIFVIPNIMKISLVTPFEPGVSFFYIKKKGFTGDG